MPATLSPSAAAYLALFNDILRPLQLAQAELEASRSDAGSSTTSASLRLAIEAAMAPALAEVNSVLRHHAGFGLGDAVEVRCGTSAPQKLVARSLVVFQADDGARVTVLGRQLQRSGRAGAREASFQLHRPDVAIQVLLPRLTAGRNVPDVARYAG